MSQDKDIIKVLLLEDSLFDAELVKNELQKECKQKFEFKVVISKSDFTKAVQEFNPDFVLSDYRLPQFNGLEALKIVIEHDSLLPFIIVTGSLSEEVAAESIKQGAWDYVVKERLSRLPNAFENALKLKKELMKSRKIEAELNLLKHHESIQLKLLWEAIRHAPSSVLITRKDGTIQFVNPKFEQLTGFSAEEVIGNKPSMLKSGFHSIEFYKNLWETILSGKEWKGEIQNKRKDGSLYWLEMSISPIMDNDGEIQYFVAIRNDITVKKESEEELKFRNILLSTQIETSNDAILVVNENNVIILYNKRFIEIFEIPEEYIQTKNDEVVLKYVTTRMKNPEQFFERVQYLYENKQEKSFEEIELLNGKAFERYSSPMFSNENYYYGRVWYFHDITDRKHSECLINETNKKLIHAQKIAQAGNWEDFLATGELIWSEQMFEIFGIQKTEKVILSDVVSVFPPEEMEKFNFAVNDAIANKKPYSMDYRIIRPDGVERFIHDEGEIIYNETGEATRMFGTTQDITERKRAEAELFAAKEKAEASDRLKTAFMNNISHEIRTPLNGILGFAPLIIDKTVDDENKQNYLAILDKSSQRLMQTITDYMDISLITSGSIEMRKRSFYPSEIVLDIIHSKKPEFQKKNLKLLFEFTNDLFNISVISDRELFGKIVNHILSNALKFTKEGNVKVGAVLENSNIKFYVKDSGVGIYAKNLSLIFEPFMQEDISTTRGYEGSGLGLSIVRGFVELLGGNVWVESTKGIGSTFYFTIPNAFESKRIQVDSIEEKPIITGNKPLILIAEDDSSNYMFVEAILKNDFDIIHVENGLDAVESCKNYSNINVVLMDIKLPEMNGLEATREIKKLRNNLPVIAITAYALSGDREKCIEAGCDFYIEKPFKPSILTETLSKYITQI